MNQEILGALAEGQVIDITTTGRHSGDPRRIEIVFHNIGGRLYVTGMPRKDRTRAWILNLEADPHLTFHLKDGVTADLPATARIVSDEAERRSVLAEVVKVWKGQDLETMVRFSPLIEIMLDDVAA